MSFQKISPALDLRHVLTAAHCLTTDFGAVLDPASVENIANY